MNEIKNKCKPSSLETKQVNQNENQKQMLKNFNKNGNQLLDLNENKKQKSKNAPNYFNDFNTSVEYSDQKFQVKQISKKLLCISPAPSIIQQFDQGKKQDNTLLSVFTDFKNSDNPAGIKKLDGFHKLSQSQNLKLDPIYQKERQDSKQFQAASVNLKMEQTYDFISLNEEKLQITLTDDDNIIPNQNKSRRMNTSQNQLNGAIFTEGSDLSTFESTQTIPKFQQKQIDFDDMMEQIINQHNTN